MAKHNKKKLNKGMVPIKKGAKLSEEQKEQLRKHASKHTNKHIASMRMHMLKGLSFEEAHKKAQSKVGK